MRLSQLSEDCIKICTKDENSSDCQAVSLERAWTSLISRKLASREHDFEELDAMRVMGIPHSFRLVMPRVLALAIAMPLISLWTSAAAIIGGMLAANATLDISISFFLQALPRAVPFGNVVLAMSKSAVFGVLIALIPCYFGMKVKPNTESLGRGTTSSVVTSITMVILVDALFAVLFRGVAFR